MSSNLSKDQLRIVNESLHERVAKKIGERNEWKRRAETAEAALAEALEVVRELMSNDPMVSGKYTKAAAFIAKHGDTK